MVLSARTRGELKERRTAMDLSLSTHLFVFHPLEEEILSLFPKHRFPLAELWAMPGIPRPTSATICTMLPPSPSSI